MTSEIMKLPVTEPGSMDNKSDSDNDLAEEYLGDNELTEMVSRNIASLIIGGSSIDRKSANDPKVFLFSLPFGESLANLIPSVKLPRLKFFQNDSAIRFINSQSYEKREIEQKLQRKDSISTLEEAYLYKDFRGADNSRLRAVKKALTPNIAIDAMNFINEKISTREAPAVSEANAFDGLDGDVVVLGGYRGSILRDRESGKQVWIPIKVGLNLRKVDLEVPPSDEAEYLMDKRIYSDAMLKNIGPIDISKRLIKKLSGLPNTRVHEFGYDWRLSSDINSARLKDFLQQIKNKSSRGLLVLAHSMGGMLVHHVMNQDPSLIRGIVYVGAPSECLNILGPIRFGDSVLLSKTVLTDEVNFLMRSSFVFLPDHGRVFFDKTKGEFIEMDLFDPDTWVDYNLSPLVCKERKEKSKKDAAFWKSPKHYGITYDEAYEYLGRTLKRTLKFKQELKFNKNINYPPLAVVYGNKVPSVRGVFVDGEQDIMDGNYGEFFYGPGDGVIHQKWLMPECIEGFQPVIKVASDCGHVSLMTDIEAVGKAIRAVLAKERGDEVEKEERKESEEGVEMEV